MVLEHVVSCRMGAPLLADIREFAETDGVSVSDWIRNAAALAVFDRLKPQPVPGFRVTGWRCAHVTMTACGVTLGRVTSACGCDMQPVYEPVLSAA